MKTTVKTMAILVALLFSALTLMGQKSLLFQDDYPLRAALSVSNLDVDLITDHASGSYQFSLEDRMEVESWMLSSEQWKADESETEIRLEDWMVEPGNNENINLNELITTEVEAPMKLEKWMYCCTDWKIVSL